MKYYCSIKCTKIHIVWSEIPTIRLIPLNHTHRKGFVIRRSLLSPHVTWEDPRSSSNSFLLANEDSLAHQIRTDQSLWDLGNVCFVVQEEHVPKKPKTVVTRCQGLNHGGGSPLGWGDQGCSGGASQMMDFTWFAISQWIDLLILKSIFFPLGLVPFPLARRLLSSVCYSFSALSLTRKDKTQSQRTGPPLSTHPWDSGSEWMLTYLFVISLSLPSCLALWEYDRWDHFHMTSVTYP